MPESRYQIGGGTMNKDFCPNGCDLRADLIPQEYIAKGYYEKGATHYSRLLGIEISGVYDGVLIWNCPDCGLYWPAVSEQWGYRYDKAIELIASWTKEDKNDYVQAW